MHVRGDVFRRMVVSGRAEVGARPGREEALAQLRLRYRLAALVADEYADAGFTAVVQDIALGDDLPAWVAMFRNDPAGGGAGAVGGGRGGTRGRAGQDRVR